MLGYENPAYASSLAEFGTPLELPRSGGWILEREVPGSSYRDAIGCYPLLVCRDWPGLLADLQELPARRELVSLGVVPDPFGAHDAGLLGECFGDIVMPFKEHFVTDMRRPLIESVSRHHRKYARKALQQVQVELVADAPGFLDEWVELHRNLIARHHAEGIRAYSRRAFSIQLGIPGMVVLRATHGGTTVGAQLWFQQRRIAYGHVLAFNQLGYDMGAPYALYWFALEHFLGKVDWCTMGGVSGTDVALSGGLSQFKRGWASATRTAYFCGRIFDPTRYEELVKLHGRAPDGFFPAYRSSIA